MHIVNVNENELRWVRHARGKLQAVLDQFHTMDSNVVQVVLSENEYSSLTQAQHSFYCAIKKSQYRMIARTANGNLYLLKV